MESHSLESKMIDSFKTFKTYVEESTTLKEQIRCFLAFWLLLPNCTFSYALLVSLLYFSVAIISTFFRDDLKISHAGWKEKCTVKKLVIVTVGIVVDELGYEIEDLLANLSDIVQKNAPCLLTLYYLVFDSAGSNSDDQFHDAAAEVDEANDLVEDHKLSVADSEEDKKRNLEKQAQLVKNALNRTDEAKAREDELIELLAQSRARTDELLKCARYMIAMIHDLNRQLSKSRDIEKEVKAQNEKLSTKLRTEQVQLKYVRDSLFVALQRERALEEQVDQLRKENSELQEHVDQVEVENYELFEKMDQMESDKVRLVAEYESKISELNKTVDDMEIEKSLQFSKMLVVSGKAESLWELLLQFEEQHKHEKAELKETREELETCKEEFHARLSFEASTIDHLSAQLSKYEEQIKTVREDAEQFREQHKLEESKWKETIEKLKTENKELDEKLSKHKFEKDDLCKTISVLTLKLADAPAIFNQYKEANKSLEKEKDKLVIALQKANESAEFHKKLLDEYTIV